MEVYADILIITNFIVDYFLLIITGKVIKKTPEVWRRILSAFLASLTSLIIFLPKQSPPIEILLRLTISGIICLSCFGYISLRRWLFTSAVFFSVTFCYAGGMTALWYILKPEGVAINNSVVYFDVSPIFLILFSVAGFIVFTLVSSLLSLRSKTSKTCTVTLSLCGKQADFNAVIDSGNSLSDVFTGRSVIITDRAKTLRAFGEINSDIYADRYRAVPCGTVSSAVLLDGYRCDAGRIITDEKTVELIRPVMALSKTPLCDCDAIVNPLDCD